MKMLTRACALALALLPSIALADSPVGKPIIVPAGSLPSIAIYCDNGSAYATLCNFGGGGASGSTSTTATANAPTQTEGSTTNALSTDLSGYLRSRVKQDGTWTVGVSNTDFGADCTIVSGDQAYTVGATQRCTMTATGRIKVGLSSAGNIAPAAQLATTTTADLVACKYVAAGVTFADGNTGSVNCDAAGRLLVNVAGTVTANLGTGGAGTSATPLYTASSTPSIGAPGSTAPANAQQVAGLGPSGNLRALSVGTLGGLLPGQGVPTSTRTTLTASTATPIEAAGVSARVAESFFVEATLTAPVYVCSTQTTGCSATAYDFLIPSGATAGTIYSPIFATTARLYAYSPGTPVVVLNSWVAQ